MKRRELLNGLEVIILDDGSVWTTQSAYARFSKRKQQTICYRCTAKSYPTVRVDHVDEYDDLQTKPLILKCNVPNPRRTKRGSHNGGCSYCVLINEQVFSQWYDKDAVMV